MLSQENVEFWGFILGQLEISFPVHKFLKIADDIKHVQVIIYVIPSVAGNYKLASTSVNACWDKSKIQLVM